MGSHAYLQNTYAQRNHLEKWVYIQPNLLELVISWPHVLKQRQDFRIHLDWLVLIYTSLEHQKLLISKIWYEMFGCTSASSSSKDILNVAQFWPPSYPSYRRPVWRVWPPYSKSVLEKSCKRLFFSSLHSSALLQRYVEKWFVPGGWLWMCPTEGNFPHRDFGGCVHSVFQHKS